MTLTNLVAFLLLLGACVGCGLAVDKLRNGSTVKSRRRLKYLFSRWGGLAITFVGLVLWFGFPLLTTAVNSAVTTAEGGKDDGSSGLAFMDVSVFQTLPLAGIRAVALFCFAILMVYIYMPVVYRFWKRHFIRAFYRLSEWQKIIVSFWAVSLFVYICVSLTH
jgi:hypothetical protein